MKYGPFPMLTTLGDMFPHTELTLRPCMVSLNEYLAPSPPIKSTPVYIILFNMLIHCSNIVRLGDMMGVKSIQTSLRREYDRTYNRFTHYYDIKVRIGYGLVVSPSTLNVLTWYDPWCRDP